MLHDFIVRGLSGAIPILSEGPIPHIARETEPANGDESTALNKKGICIVWSTFRIRLNSITLHYNAPLSSPIESLRTYCPRADHHSESTDPYISLHPQCHPRRSDNYRSRTTGEPRRNPNYGWNILRAQTSWCDAFPFVHVWSRTRGKLTHAS